MRALSWARGVVKANRRLIFKFAVQKQGAEDNKLNYKSNKSMRAPVLTVRYAQLQPTQSFGVRIWR